MLFKWVREHLPSQINLEVNVGEGNGTPLQCSCLENPMDVGAWCTAVHGVTKSWTWLSDFTFTFHFQALEQEMATHSSVLAWRIPGTGEPGGLLSMGSHRVGHDWSDLAAAVGGWLFKKVRLFFYGWKKNNVKYQKHFCNIFSDLENSSWYIKWKSKLQQSKHNIIPYLQNNYIYIHTEDWYYVTKTYWNIKFSFQWWIKGIFISLCFFIISKFIYIE